MSSWRSKTTDSVQSVQTRLGKIVKKAPADDHNVTAMIKDYEAGDTAITKIINEAKCLQVAWHDMAFSQLGIANAFQELYGPIGVGADGEADEEDEQRVVPAATPHHLLRRSTGLQQVYTSLRDEMRDEITAMETLLLRPAIDAKDLIQPIKKTIKKRDKMRVDFENAQAKVTKLQRKPGKSDKEEMQLVKAQGDLSVLSEAFETADSHLRETLPPLVHAISSIISPLLSSVVLIQNRLLGLCYTVIHEYCQENGFQSPAPPMEDVVAEWEHAFGPIASEVEAFSSVRKHMALHGKPENNHSLRGRTVSFQRLKAPLSRVSSGSSQPHQSPDRSPEPSEYSAPTPKIQSKTTTPGGLAVPTDFTSATVLRGSRSTSSLASQRSDYFGQAAIAKKKPPPPPPGPKPKRQAEFVEAQFDFQGVGADDLSFKAGDRIRVIERTNTDQDWWRGELGGYQGSFPANYCRPMASN